MTTSEDDPHAACNYQQARLQSEIARLQREIDRLVGELHAAEAKNTIADESKFYPPHDPWGPPFYT